MSDPAISTCAPTVSVLVPLYQAGRWIADALDSVLAQSFEDFEVIVVDDGSTDDGGEIARSYAARDERVRYLWQENTGLPGARNRGLAVARATYIGFLDADDEWLPQKLERQLPLAGDHVLYADAYLLRGDERSTERITDNVPAVSGDVLDPLLERNIVPVVTALLPRALLERFGGFDVTQRQVEDWDLWLRMSASGVQFHHLPEPVALYRVRADALSADYPTVAAYRVRALRKVRALVPTDRRATVDRRLRSERSLLAGELRLRAWQRTAEGDVCGARADVDAALRAEPSSVKGIAAAVIARVPPLLRRVARRELSRA